MKRAYNKTGKYKKPRSEWKGWPPRPSQTIHEFLEELPELLRIHGITEANGCISWKGLKKYRPAITREKKAFHLARAVVKKFHDPQMRLGDPDTKHALHRCDVPWCINPDHLFSGTAEENAQDMTKKGRRGGPAKLYNI